MPSNVTWEKTPKIALLPPEEVTKALTETKKVVDGANSLLNTIEGILNFVSPFITKGADLVALALGVVSTTLNTLMKDVFGLGGGYILIHPFNRKNKTYKKIGVDVASITIPTMTPKEAFDELAASFNNVNDPLRPRWTKNNKVAGWGLLITTEVPAPFVEVMNTFSTIFSIGDDFKQIADTMDKAVRNAVNDVVTQCTTTQTDSSYMNKTLWSAYREQNKNKSLLLGPDVVDTWNSGGLTPTDIKMQDFLAHAATTDLTTYKTTTRDIIDMTGKSWTTAEGAGKNLSIIATDIFINDAHWEGLSLENITFFKEITAKLDEFTKTLSSMVSTSSAAIVETIKAITRRIKVIVKFINDIYDVIAPLISMLGDSNTAIYIFFIPSGVGGVEYITGSIRSSIESPTSDSAKALQTCYTSNNFSALLFAAASTEIDLSAWEAFYKNAWTDMEGKVKEIEALGIPYDFTVSPTIEGTVFDIQDTIKLKVYSTESSSQKQMYYEYTVYDDQDKVVVTNVSSGIYWSKYKVNITEESIQAFKLATAQTRTPSTLQPYKLVVKTYYDLQALPVEKTFNFSVAIKNLATTSESTNPVVGTNDNGITTVTDETITVFDDGTGVTISEITGTTSTDTIPVDIEKMPPTVVSTVFPVPFVVSGDGSFTYRKKGDTEWIGPLPLPSTINLGSGEFEYRTCIDGVWSDTLILKTRVGDPNVPTIC